MARSKVSDAEIARRLQAGEKHYALAKELGVSPSTVYRAETRARQAQPDTYAASMRDVGRGITFTELGTTGLRRFGGRIDDEYDRQFKDLYKRVQLYREMADDAVVAAVDQAHRMVIRRVPWEVEAGGETTADEDAAEFVRQCMDDMSLSWLDFIDNIMPMFRYGFQLAEIVWKRRQGERREGGSKYDDGRIGWRKFIFIAPESLDRGEPWLIDDHGGLQGARQTPLTSGGKPVDIPIDKLILFRTTTEKNNPEGRSLYRAQYQSWYFKHNLEEVEAISAERNGAGFPVIYAGRDVGKSKDGESDLVAFKDIVVNMRVDDQMGLVIPYAKMGAGAKEGEGALVEFLAPPGKGVVDFNQVITRYEQRMAMVGLAQFIHLGMNGVGARALGESGQDFFTLAVTGWVDAIADTINRFAVEPLLKFNYFPGLTAYPKIVHGPVAQTDLAQIADYINKLAGAQLVTPHPDMERALLELADMPAHPKLDEKYEEKDKQAAEMAELSKQAALAPKQAALAPKPAVGAPVDQDNDPDGDKPAPEKAGWLEQEIDDVKARELIELMTAKVGGGGNTDALVAELRRANDLMAMSLGGAAAPASQSPVNINLSAEIDSKDLIDGLRSGVREGMSELRHITAPDMQPVADALRAGQQATERFAASQAERPIVVNVPKPDPVVVNVAAPPAPIISLDLKPVADAIREVGQMDETVEVKRDDAGLMQSATKRRKRKGA